MADDTTQQPTQPGTQPVPQQQALAPQVDTRPIIPLNMDTVQGFEALQRAAKMLASSSLVPPAYQGNIPNCTLALAIAMRMKADPLMVLQNLYIIHGRPGWSATFMIATINSSGKFSPLRFQFQGTQGQDNFGCKAVARDRETGEVLESTLVTVGMAKKQGWYDRKDSKWASGMEEQMLRYRAAAFWARTYAPEVSLGFQTQDELEDLYPEQRSQPERDVTPPQQHPRMIPTAPPVEPPPATEPQVQIRTTEVKTAPVPHRGRRKAEPAPESDQGARTTPAMSTAEVQPPAQPSRDPQTIGSAVAALRSRMGLGQSGQLPMPPASAPTPPPPAQEPPEGWVEPDEDGDVKA